MKSINASPFRELPAEVDSMVASSVNNDGSRLLLLPEFQATFADTSSTTVLVAEPPLASGVRNPRRLRMIYG